MTLSFHVCNGLCPEQVYAGMQARYDAYFVDIPDEYFPKDLLDAVSNIMTKEERNLLFRVFCDGYPNGLKFSYEGEFGHVKENILYDLNNRVVNHSFELEGCMPYLRSWKNATQKEKRELNKLLPHDFEACEWWGEFSIFGDEDMDFNTNLYRMSVDVKDFLDEHHFNYRLPQGMFIEAPKNMYKH